ncbi:hypothetical protein [Methylocella tundrae]|uniref:hypothetical protein n=1 Tax=Methylocella tundrae TaxID=227605 RepID=UPI0030FE41C9|nr:hypothetical protein SIN04_08455 [Methylocella tundrae]
MTCIKSVLAFVALVFISCDAVSAGEFSRDFSQTETLGAQLRRLAAAARNNNPVERPQLIGGQAWLPLAGAYPGSGKPVAAGALYSSGGNVYYAFKGGTTGSNGAPTSTSRNYYYSDGGVSWVYVGLAAGDQVSNGGSVYEVVIAGLPATSGAGPTGFSSAIMDGTIVWKYVGPQTAPVATNAAGHNASLTNFYGATQGLPANALIPDNSGAVRFEGGWPFVQNATATVAGPNVAPNANGAGCGRNLTILGDSGLDIQCNYQSFTVLSQANIIEFALGNSSAINIIVDDSYVSPVRKYIIWDNPAYLQLDFTNSGGRKFRKIKVEFSSANGLAGVAVGPTDSLFYPAESDNFGIALVGSSLSVATTASSQAMGWGNRFRYLVGLPDYATFAIGATGILNPAAPSSSYGTNYAGHFIGDLKRYAHFRGAPKVILIEAPINDTKVGDPSFTPAALQTAALALLKDIRSQYPNALIIGVGSAWGSDNHLKGTVSTTDAANSVVTLSGGDRFGLTGMTTIDIDNVVYPVSSVSNPTQLTISGNAGAHGGLPYYAPYPLAIAVEYETAFMNAVTLLQRAGDHLTYFIQNNSLKPPQYPFIMGAGRQTVADGTCATAHMSGSKAGNAIFDVSSGGPHLTDCGYDEWGRRVAEAYRVIIEKLP